MLGLRNMSCETNPSAGDVALELERVLSSEGFSGSDRLRRFLRFVVEKTAAGEADDIKEYLVATEVYGRPVSYDPKVDSIVRVEASRLRTKLREYYSGEGAASPIRIELPKGAYVPAFHLTAVEPPQEPEPLPEPVVVAESPARHSRGVRIAVATIAALALCVSGWVAWRTYAGRNPTAGMPSVAVLPFVNLASERTHQAYADGLTEDVTESLSKDSSLRVAGRHVASRFKGRADSVPSLGKQLGVSAILEGTVRQDGDRVRITAQLVSTTDGFHIWSETYDRSVRDQLSVQAEISGLISQAVATRLATESSPDAPENVELFRKATAILNSQTDHILLKGDAVEQPKPLAELTSSIAYFEQAVARYPKHARAWAGLAQAYTQAAEYDPRMNPKARQSAERAVGLDAGIGAAHSILGYGYFLHDWDFVRAEAEFTKALDVDHRLLGTYRLYGDCASILGRQDEALARIDRALVAFPNQKLLSISRAIVLYHARRYEDMENQARRLLAVEPELGPAHWLLGLALEQRGRNDEAIREFESALRLSTRDQRAATALGHLYAKAGRRADALRIAGQFAERSQYARPSYSIAMIHAGLGDVNTAFEWLQRSHAQHETSLPYMKLDPRFDGMRKDPRFDALLRQMKLL